jgi:DNA-binding transcriptional ArsR family regulator
MAIDLDAVLEALSDPIRRDIFERIVIRPRYVGELASELPVTRPTVSHHVRVLRDAGLVSNDHGPIQVLVDALPSVRMYFDRLWLEASLGDGWLASRRTETRDLGL